MLLFCCYLVNVFFKTCTTSLELFLTIGSISNNLQQCYSDSTYFTVVDVIVHYRKEMTMVLLLLMMKVLLLEFRLLSLLLVLFAAIFYYCYYVYFHILWCIVAVTNSFMCSDSFCLSILICQFVCISKVLLICHEFCML